MYVNLAWILFRIQIIFELTFSQMYKFVSTIICDKLFMPDLYC